MVDKNFFFFLFPSIFFFRRTDLVVVFFPFSLRVFMYPEREEGIKTDRACVTSLSHPIHSKERRLNQTDDRFDSGKTWIESNSIYLEYCLPYKLRVPYHWITFLVTGV